MQDQRESSGYLEDVDKEADIQPDANKRPKILIVKLIIYRVENFTSLFFFLFFFFLKKFLGLIDKE